MAQKQLFDWTEQVPGHDVYIYHGKVHIPNTYYAGTIGTKWLIEIRDNKKITGTKCPACDLVYVPARSTCKDCFGQLDQFVEVSDKGTVVTYAVACQANGAQPVDLPIIYAVIRLDGASTDLVHMLGEVDLEELAIGMRVKAVFSEKRTGSILDIKYFKPLV